MLVRGASTTASSGREGEACKLSIASNASYISLYCFAADAEGYVAERYVVMWSPARIFMAVSAAYHLLLGIAGLVVDQTFAVGPDAVARAGSGFVFGIFETNGWHSVAGLLVGFASRFSSLDRNSSKVPRRYTT